MIVYNVRQLTTLIYLFASNTKVTTHEQTQSESAVFKLWMLYFQRMSFQIFECCTSHRTFEKIYNQMLLYFLNRTTVKVKTNLYL